MQAARVERGETSAWLESILMAAERLRTRPSGAALFNTLLGGGAWDTVAFNTEDAREGVSSRVVSGICNWLRASSGTPDRVCAHEQRPATAGSAEPNDSGAGA